MGSEALNLEQGPALWDLVQVPSRKYESVIWDLAPINLVAALDMELGKAGGLAHVHVVEGFKSEEGGVKTGHALGDLLRYEGVTTTTAPLLHHQSLP